MAYCNDCGCRMSDGICSNCHEELYILEYQGDYIDFDLSEDFLEKAENQLKEVEQKKEFKYNDQED